MKNLRSEEENIIKDIRNLFRLKKLNYTAIKDIRNLFRLKKETKAIKDRILRDIKNLFEHKEEENYYKPVRVSNFGVTVILNTKVTVIEIKHYQLKNILIKLDHILKDIISNLKKSDTRKIQLTIANNFISSIDNDEERVMHSKSDNIEITINDEADEVIEELFESLKNRY